MMKSILSLVKHFCSFIKQIRQVYGISWIPRESKKIMQEIADVLDLDKITEP